MCSLKIISRNAGGRHPRWGWKTAHAVLRREAGPVNRKRTHRPRRSEGLKKLAPCKRKRRRPEGAENSSGPNGPTTFGRWTSQFDETADHRSLAAECPSCEVIAVQTGATILHVVFQKSGLAAMVSPGRLRPGT